MVKKSGRGGAGGARALKARVRKTGLKNSSRRWLERHLNDPYVHRAKAEGYRSRAAFKLPELLETAHYFLAPHGRLIAMKGPNFRQEADRADIPDLLFQACHSITVPFSQRHRNILIYQRDI